MRFKMGPWMESVKSRIPADQCGGCRAVWIRVGEEQMCRGSGVGGVSAAS